MPQQVDARLFEVSPSLLIRQLCKYSRIAETLSCRKALVISTSEASIIQKSLAVTLGWTQAAKKSRVSFSRTWRSQVSAMHELKRCCSCFATFSFWMRYQINYFGHLSKDRTSSKSGQGWRRFQTMRFSLARFSWLQLFVQVILVLAMRTEVSVCLISRNYPHFLSSLFSLWPSTWLFLISSFDIDLSPIICER